MADHLLLGHCHAFTVWKKIHLLCALGTIFMLTLGEGGEMQVLH